MLRVRTNPPFRVLYDLRWMELGRAGGVEQATYELVNAVARIDRKNAYRILAPRSACWEWDFPPTFDVLRIPSDAGEPAGERLHRHIAERAAGRGDPGFDLVHTTCSYTHPEVIDFPGVLTIQDLQHLHHPEFFEQAELRNRDALYKISAERARHIICGSEFTRRDVHERFGIPLERMTTVWNIPGEAWWQEIAEEKRRALIDRMGVRGPFLFYPAQSWLHKNHARLVEAFARIVPRLPREFCLVFAGRPFPADHPALQLLQGSHLASRVVHLGYRSPLEVRALMQACVGLVFPSLFEGFGMPVAEAIVCGKPIACSNAASLPEIAGDAAISFDPLDIDQMAARMLEIATDAQLRESLADASLRRRHLFSGHASALATVAIYERVVLEMHEKAS